jgi:hypothetical protein
MSDSILQRELDEAKASITVTYWHLFQTTENLLKEITRLSSRNTQLMAENEKQRVLLAALKRESATPRTISGGEDSRDLPAGTVVIDKIGDAWRRYRLEGWVSTGDGPYDSLPESCAPYTIVYTPTPKENTND